MSLHTLETIKLSAEVIDQNKDLVGGMTMWWTRGAHVVLIQSWTMEGGEKVWGPVNPDPMSGETLLGYYIECWNASRVPGHEVSRLNVEVCT